MSEPAKCEYQTYLGTYFDPPEYCPNDAEPGEDYCLDHIPDDPDWEDDYKDDLLVEPWDEFEGTDE